MSRPLIPAKPLISAPRSALEHLEYPGGNAQRFINTRRAAAAKTSLGVASAFGNMAAKLKIAEVEGKAKAAPRYSSPFLSTVSDEPFNEAPAAAAAAPLKSVTEIKINQLFKLINDESKHNPKDILGLLSEIAGREADSKTILNSRDVNGYTPLCLACDKDYDYFALQLIKLKDVDIYLPDSLHKDTPLIYASRHGLLGVVESLLIENEKRMGVLLAKRYIDYQGMGGQTALHNACNPAIYEVNKKKPSAKYNSDKQKIFDLLIKNGANLEITDVHGNLASVLCAPRMAKKGGYRATRRDKKYLKRYKQGKSIGFTMRASLKAKGLIPRANGTRRVSKKYK